MAERFPLSTCTVLVGGASAVGVACVALDMTATLPVAVRATRTAAPANTQIFRIIGPPVRLP